MKQAGKSVLAVVGGYAAAVALSAGIGFVMYRIYDATNFGRFEWHHYPYYTWATLAADLGRLVVSVVFGGFVASRIAGRAPVWHSGAVSGLILAPMAAYTFPHSDFHPNWYWLAHLAAIVPAAILGGWLSLYRRKVTA